MIQLFCSKCSEKLEIEETEPGDSFESVELYITPCKCLSNLYEEQVYKLPAKLNQLEAKN